LTRVPRFYFDVREGGSFTPDNEGLPFDGIREARTEAARMLAEMMKDAMPDGPRYDIGVEVRDEAKRPLLKVQLTFAVEPLA
jgi:hypothetical protein